MSEKRLEKPRGIRSSKKSLVFRGFHHQKKKCLRGYIAKDLVFGVSKMKSLVLDG